MVLVLSSFTPLEQNQVQLLIDVYQSQGNTNQIFWIFSGFSIASTASSIRTSGSYSSDTWDIDGNIYDTNSPNGTAFQLSSLLFSTNNSIDIDAVRKRIPDGGRTDVTFAANATNMPMIPHWHQQPNHFPTLVG